MTMKEMVQEFERRGFTVEKGYSPIKIGYDFTISKDGHSVSDFFPYPENKPNNVKHGLQVDFIEELVKKFNSTICGDNVKHSLIHDALTSLRYTHGEGILSVAGYESMPVRITDLRSELRPFDRCPHISIEADVLYDLDDNKERMRGVTAAIDRVIFNDPATIVFWSDGTKTVVKCQDGDEFNPEVGLTMAIAKKAFGNKGNYCNRLKKWLPKKYLCMYCGAETTNDSWGHMCDECKNEPLDPIPENLKKSICHNIKIPKLTGIKDAIEGMNSLAKSLANHRKRSAVQKAYDALVKYRDGSDTDTDTGLDVNELIGLLGEALED